MGDGRCLTSRDTLLQIVKLLLSQRYQLTLRKERKLSRVQLFATPCDPLPGSSVHGIFQARILEWIAISFSRGFSQLRDQTQVSHTASRLLTICATREAHKLTLGQVQLANWNDLCSPHPIPALKKSPTLGILMPFICIPMADSCWCIRNQHNIVKKLSSN